MYRTRWRLSGSTIWTEGNKTSLWYYNVSNLVNNKTYEWQVKAFCSDADSSDYSQSAYFNTTCRLPTLAPASQIKPASIQLNWFNRGENIKSDIRWRKAGQTEWTTISNLSSTSVSLSGLTPEVTYEWQVRAVCGENDYSDYTAINTFLPHCIIPEPLSEKVLSSAATLFWNASSATKFIVQWRELNTSEWQASNVITDHTYTLTGLTYSKEYEWRVKTVCDENLMSDFSSIRSFTALCSNPVIVSLSNLTSTTSRLTWVYENPDLQYEVRWRKNGSAVWSMESNLMTNAFLFTGLTPGADYEYQLRLKCTDNQYSAYTAIRSFKQPCLPPDAFQYTYLNSGLSISWESDPGILWNLHWRNEQSAEWQISTPLSESNFLLDKLVAGTLYYVKVESVCSPNLHSAFSLTMPVRIECTPPDNTAEANLSPSTERIYWRTIGYGVRYELRWRVSGSVNWSTVDTLTTPGYTLGGLKRGITYEWQIRSKCSQGQASDFTQIRSFTIPCPTPQGLYEIFSSHLSNNLFWNRIDSLAYRVRWRKTGTGTWITSGVLTTNSLSLSLLESSTRYEWAVQAVCADGVGGDYSLPRSFSTSACDVLSGTQEYGISPTSALVYWDSFSGSRYQLQWRSSETQPWNTTLLSINTFALSRLSIDSTYEWQVQNVCADESRSLFTVPRSFSLTCSKPTAYYEETTSDGGITLYWIAKNGTSRFRVFVRKLNDTIAFTSQVLSGTLCHVTGLTPGEQYKWQVEAVCSDKISSGFENVRTFIAQGACQFPTSTSQKLALTSAVLSWNNTNGNAYVVRWRAVGDPVWTVTHPVITTSCSLTGLVPGKAYEWQVKSICKDTVSSLFSPMSSFTTQCQKVTSTGSFWITPSSAYLSWSPIDNRTIFEYRWRETGTSEWNSQSDVKENVVKINGLKTGKQYEWQVRALCNGSVFGEYSDALVFTAACKPPPNTSVLWVKPDETLLGWSLSGEANTYNLRWRQVGSTQWSTVFNLSGQRYQLTGLTNKTRYQWQIQSICEDGSLSEFSDLHPFQTDCAPLPYTSIEATSPTSAHLVWSGISGLTYKVDWRKAGETTWNSLTTLSNNITLSNLQPETTYQYRLQSICTSEISSAYTTIQQFTTGCYFDTFAYTDNITSNAARVRWSAPLQGQRFQVRWRVQGTQDWIISEVLRTNSLSLPNLANSTTYEWQLRAICQDQSSTEYGQANEFTTQCSIPCCTKSFNSTRSSVLTWQSFGPAAHYRLRWRMTGSQTWTIADNLPNSQLQLYDLAAGQAYEWQVQTLCSDDNESAFSPVTSFTFIAIDCDPLEPNNTPATATPVASTTFSSASVCLDTPIDKDWFKWSFRGQDYYILVMPWDSSANTGNNTGSYRLYLNVNNDTLTVETQSVNGSQTDTYLLLYNADRSILLAENDDTNWPFSQIKYKLPTDCLLFYTLKSGNWTDPGIWSCNRVPGEHDSVQLLHRITIPANHTAPAAKITIGNGGVLLLSDGAKLRTYK